MIRNIKIVILGLMLCFPVNSMEYEQPSIEVEYHHASPIRPAFEEPEIEQAPFKATKAIDWDNLPYDDASIGWYYQLLWYLYHPSGTETPPWLKPVVPVGDGIGVLMALCIVWCLLKFNLQAKHKASTFFGRLLRAKR